MSICMFHKTWELRSNCYGSIYNMLSHKNGV